MIKNINVVDEMNFEFLEKCNFCYEKYRNKIKEQFEDDIEYGIVLEPKTDQEFEELVDDWIETNRQDIIDDQVLWEYIFNNY